MRYGPRYRLAATALGASYVLKACLPHPARLAHGLRSPRSWVADAGADAAIAALAGALLWLIALWVALSLAAAAASLLPGRFGQLARVVATRATPAALRRIVVTAAGTSILLSPVAAVAAPTSGGPAPNGASAVMPPLGWPTDPAPATVTGSRGSAVPGTPPRDAGDGVRVRPGDSLWSMAAQRLGPAAPAARVQAEWPRWYAVNRRVIGTDPNLLRPGTSLTVPGSAHPDSTK